MSLTDLFSRLLSMSLTGGATVLIVCLARLCLKRAPRWISYLLWFAVLFRLLCPVSFTASFSLIPASLSSGSLVESWQDNYLGNTVILHEGASDAYDQAVAAGRQPVYGGEGGHYVVTQEDLVSEPSTVSDTLLPLLSRLWLAGFAGMAGCGLVSYIRLKKKLAGCPVLEDQVFLCSHIPTPFVMGIFRPRIYLPAYLSEEERQYILLHERHHIRRGDPLTRILFYLALCLHWFNPLVWLAFVLSGRDMEVSCDEAVIRKLGPDIRADYAGSLLRFAAGGRIPGPFSPAFGENAAKERIRNLARWSRPTAGLLAAGGLLALAVCLGLILNGGRSQIPDWLQELTPQQIESIELTVMPQSPHQQYRVFSPEEFSAVSDLLCQARGPRVLQPEELSGQTISFRLVLSDGTEHTVSNLSNQYLLVDDETFRADSDWLAGWEAEYGAGNAALPSASEESTSVDSPPPQLDQTSAADFISQTLRTLTLHSDGTVSFRLPEQIPQSADEKTRLTITLSAGFTPEADTYSSQELLDWEMNWEGGETYTGQLDTQKGELYSVFLRVAFMTQVGPDSYQEYAADYQELLAPFSYEEPAGYTAPSMEILGAGPGANLRYTDRDGQAYSLSFTLPQGLRLYRDEEESSLFLYLLDQEGYPVGQLALYPFGATDQETLSQVDTAKNELPMEIFATTALSNHAGYENYRVQRHTDTGASALAQYRFQDLSDAAGNAASLPWQEKDCVLAYDWAVMPFYAEILLEPGTLTDAQREELAASFVLATDN